MEAITTSTQTPGGSGQSSDRVLFYSQARHRIMCLTAHESLIRRSTLRQNLDCTRMNRGRRFRLSDLNPHKKKVVDPFGRVSWCVKRLGSGYCDQGNAGVGKEGLYLLR